MIAPSFLAGRHVMIDIETLSVGSDPVILSIGAQEFWPAERTTSERGLSAHISLESSFAARRVVDPSTILFWLRQDDDARHALIIGQENSVSFREALEALAEYCHADNGRQGMDARREPPAAVWGHGAAFDLAHLEQAYRAGRIECPWDYSRQRDTRTLFAMAGKRLSELGGDRQVTYHDALNDARYQVRAVIAALDIINPQPKEEEEQPHGQD